MLGVHYGRPRNYLRCLYHDLLLSAGAFRRCIHIDWPRVDRLVFVCDGNICRSPFAEVVARAHDVPSISCGIIRRDQTPADVEAIYQARKRGFDLGTHVSQGLDQVQWDAGDLAVCMEPRHLRVALPSPDVQRTLLRLWCQPPRPDLPDPYGLTNGYFSHCYDLIDEGVTAIAGHMPRHGPDL